MGAAGIWLIPTFGDLGPCTLFRPRGEISPEIGECGMRDIRPSSAHRYEQPIP